MVEKKRSHVIRLEGNPTIHEPGKGGRVNLECKVTIIHLSHVDHKAQSFRAELVLRANTTNIVRDGIRPDKTARAAGHKLVTVENWNPRIRFLNLSETMRWDEKPKTATGKTGEEAEQTELQYKYTVNGVFTCPFSLELFPYDTQILKFKLSSAQPVAALNIVHNPLESSVIQVDGFSENNVYELEPVVGSLVTQTDPEDSSSNTVRPILETHVVVRRKASYYYHNMLYPMMVIVGIAHGSFAIDQEDTSARLDVTLAMLLAAVFYKFVIADSLPDLSYITLIDAFLLTCFTLIGAVAVQNVFAARLSEAEDNLCAKIFLGFLAVFALVTGCCGLYFQWLQKCRFQERQKEWDAQAKAKKILAALIRIHDKKPNNADALSFIKGAAGRWASRAKAVVAAKREVAGQQELAVMPKDDEEEKFGFGSF